MDKDLSRPGPMLDPRIYGLREPPMAIYYPYFKAYLEEEERKMHERERKEKREADMLRQSVVVESEEIESEEVKVDVTAPPVPPLPSRKSL